MKSFANRAFAAAALLVLSGAAAFAQSSMTAEIPFAFKTPNATLEPGRYQFTDLMSGVSSHYYSIRNLDTGKAVALLAPNVTYRKSEEKLSAQIAFECAGEVCVLRAIYPAFTRVGHQLPTQLKAEREAGREVAEVRIPATR